MTKHNLVGDLLYATVFNYFAFNDLQDKIAAQASGIVTYRLPSYGLFRTNLITQYWYGIPKNVEFGGLVMDVDLMKLHHVSKTNNADERKAFTESIAPRMSAMEHLVPEQMFSTETEKAQGISAVKAIALASQQGQKIWTIDESNLELALGAINLGADTEGDIRNAVNAGKIVTTHTTKINFNGWIGEGYTMIDPQTGAGAYMIAGGGNGSETIVKTADVLNWISFTAGLKFALYTVSWGRYLGVMLSGINMITSLISFGLGCPNFFDQALLFVVVFFSLLAMILTVLLPLLGIVGLLGSILISILFQSLGVYIGRATKDAC